MPHLTENYHLNFYGGEPLLCFDLIEKTVSFLNKKNKELNKKAHFAVTTNGSLFNPDIYRFFNQHKFSVELSFDGLVQNQQRKEGSFEKIAARIDELLKYPEIHVETNSVFTPQSVESLSESTALLLDLNIPNIRFSLSVVQPWNPASLHRLEKEMVEVRKIAVSDFKQNDEIRVVNFREEPGRGFFYCAAGKDRLALTPEGKVWGCFLFPDYFDGKENSPEYQKYCFGNLDNFTRNHQKSYAEIYKNYARLRMDNFSTPRMPCFLCSELENCSVCPISAAFSGNPLGEVPAYVCEIQKIKIKEKKKFREEHKKRQKRFYF